MATVVTAGHDVHMTSNPVEAYGHWLATVDDAWPEEALTLAYRELVDVVAVMVPGGVTPVATRVLEVVQAWGEGDCSVVATEQRLPLPWAAQVNGTAAHALDFDGSFDPSKTHASVVLWPAILAVADHLRCSPRACLDAYVAALQIMGRIGQAVNPPHRKRGWHATATIGAIGAAAATARLFKLDAERSAMALSLATSTAAGFMSQFGTMAKPLHAGNAARGGIQSACFAAAGVTAGRHTLDGPIGMNTLMVGPDREALQAAIREPEHGQTLTFETEQVGEPLLIVEHRFRAKRFPTCGSAHRSLDAMLDLLQRHAFTPDEVERIDVHAPAMHLKNLMYQRPQDGLQGKFSVEYPLSCLLIDRACTIADFTDAAVNRPSHRALFERIHRHAIDRPETEVDTTIRVTLIDGRVLEKSVFMPLGSKVAPFPMTHYWQKFDECTRTVMPDDARDRLRAALEGFLTLETASEMTCQVGIALQPAGSAGPA